MSLNAVDKGIYYVVSNNPIHIYIYIYISFNIGSYFVLCHARIYTPALAIVVINRVTWIDPQADTIHEQYVL